MKFLLRDVVTQVLLTVALLQCLARCAHAMETRHELRNERAPWAYNPQDDQDEHDSKLRQLLEHGDPYENCYYDDKHGYYEENNYYSTLIQLIYGDRACDHCDGADSEDDTRSYSDRSFHYCDHCGGNGRVNTWERGNQWGIDPAVSDRMRADLLATDESGRSCLMAYMSGAVSRTEELDVLEGLLTIAKDQNKLLELLAMTNNAGMNVFHTRFGEIHLGHDDPAPGTPHLEQLRTLVGAVASVAGDADVAQALSETFPSGVSTLIASLLPVERDCPDCGGTGRGNRCETCNGTGKIPILDQQTEYGKFTPVMDVLRSRVEDALPRVRLLVEAGADLLLTDRYGRTALDMARIWHGPEIVSYLAKRTPTQLPPLPSDE